MKKPQMGWLIVAGLLIGIFGWAMAPGVARAGDDAVASALRGIRDEIHELRSSRERVECSCKCER